jgi:outer membrane protein assembly factor BamB
MSNIPSTTRWPLLIVATLLTATALSGCIGGGQVPAESWPGLTIEGETAYVAFTSAVHAVDIQSGREIWRYPAPSDEPETLEIFYAAPALTDDNQLIIASYSNKVFLLDAETGINVGDEVILGDGLGRVLGGPILDDDHAYIPSTDGCLYAYDLNSGVAACLFNAEGSLWASPLIADGIIFVASLDHRIHALEQDSGDTLWSRDLSAAVAGTPTLVDDHLIAPTLGKGVIAMDPSDGSIEWEFETSGWVWGTPAVADGVVYFADAEGFVYAANAATGEEVWSFHPDVPIVAPPVIEGDFLYLCTSEGVLVRQAADNLPAWQQPLEGRQLTRPAVSGDTLLVASIESDNLLTALILESGAIRWPISSEE